jgi:hypothetical protein
VYLPVVPLYANAISAGCGIGFELGCRCAERRKMRRKRCPPLKWARTAWRPVPAQMGEREEDGREGR